MINLLPPDIKSGYNYARWNVHLIHWIVAFAVALIGLLAIGTVGLAYMQHLSNTYNQQIDADNVSLKNQKLKQVQANAKEVSNNLKLAVQVLGKEVLFSELLKQLAILTPNNAVLSNLTINQTTGALDITAKTTNYQAAAQLQANLEDPANKIFSKADLINTNCDSSNQEDSQYPCTATFRVLFVTNNPFLFINAEKQ